MDEDLIKQLSTLREMRLRAGLFLDFDGTLAPIVNDPSSAVAFAGTADAINDLAKKFAVVAVVSGRPLEFLRERLVVDSSVRLRGLYGLQQLRHGVIYEEPQAAKWRSVVDQGATTAEAELPKGVRVERKGMSFVLHYRTAPELSATVEEWAARFAQYSGLDAQRARRAVELGPFLNIDKGSTVSEMCNGLTGAAVIGDDSGDIPMFCVGRAFAREKRFLSLNIAVDSEELPPALAKLSDATVASPQEVLEVLRYLAS